MRYHALRKTTKSTAALGARATAEPGPLVLLCVAAGHSDAAISGWAGVIRAGFPAALPRFSRLFLNVSSLLSSFRIPRRARAFAQAAGLAVLRAHGRCGSRTWERVTWK